MSVVRIIMGDPARTSDPFGIVGIEGDLEKDIIRVKLAKQFTERDANKRMARVCGYLQNIRDEIKPHYMGFESNNDGHSIISYMKGKGLPLHGITTSANLTAARRRGGYAMDKPRMIEWFSEYKDNHKIQFPEGGGADMEELIKQISLIVRQRTPTGNYTYRAERGRHDDLFMALLLCCHIYKVYMQKRTQVYDD